jgi:hypothetical protein
VAAPHRHRLGPTVEFSSAGTPPPPSTDAAAAPRTNPSPVRDGHGIRPESGRWCRTGRVGSEGGPGRLRTESNQRRSCMRPPRAARIFKLVQPPVQVGCIGTRLFEVQSLPANTCGSLPSWVGDRHRPRKVVKAILNEAAPTLRIRLVHTVLIECRPGPIVKINAICRQRRPARLGLMRAGPAPR